MTLFDHAPAALCRWKLKPSTAEVDAGFAVFLHFAYDCNPDSGRLEAEGIDSGPLDRFITLTSKISYSLYLGHIAMLTLVNGIMRIYVWTAPTASKTLVVYAAYFACYYAFAYFTCRVIGQPYLKLRDLISKGN